MPCPAGCVSRWLLSHATLQTRTLEFARHAASPPARCVTAANAVHSHHVAELGQVHVGASASHAAASTGAGGPTKTQKDGVEGQRSNVVLRFASHCHTALHAIQHASEPSCCTLCRAGGVRGRDVYDEGAGASERRAECRHGASGHGQPADHTHTRRAAGARVRRDRSLPPVLASYDVVLIVVCALVADRAARACWLLER